MTKIRVLTPTGVISEQAGIVDGTSADFYDGLKQGFIGYAGENMLKFLQDNKSAYGMSKVTFSMQYPEFVAGKGNEYEAQMKLPQISLQVQLTGTKKTIGMSWGGSQDGPVKYFTQNAILSFECLGSSSNTADRLASTIINLIMQKLPTLQNLGFHNMEVRYSRPNLGWNPQFPVDWNENPYRYRVNRHMIDILTSFDVTWISKEDSYGTITQIVWKNSGDVIFEYKMGNSLAYMLVEDMEFAMHGVLI